MKTNLMNRMNRLAEMVRATNDGLWAGRFATEELKEMAYRSMDKMNETYERVKRVLEVRYGM